jgi:hypothetical protein
VEGRYDTSTLILTSLYIRTVISYKSPHYQGSVRLEPESNLAEPGKTWKNLEEPGRTWKNLAGPGRVSRPYGEIVGEDEIAFSLMLGGELLT